MMQHRHRVRRMWATLILSALALCNGGCDGGTLIGLGGFFTGIGDTLNAAGTCLSPLDFTSLDGVIIAAEPVTWDDDEVTLHDGEHPELAAFYKAELGGVVLPLWLNNERLWTLGPMEAGDVLRITFLSDLANSIYIYDHALEQRFGVFAHDLSGQLRTVELPIYRDADELYLRLLLEQITDRDDPVLQLTRLPGAAAEPVGQTVVLVLGGAENVTFRNGNILPTAFGAIDDADVRAQIVATFKELYADYDLTVLTDVDPEPAGLHSRIYIGPASPGFGHNGISEFSDGGNLVAHDIAIVDINSEHLTLVLTFAPGDYGRAIGLVAAHEMGHLLGLAHVVDADALMTGIGCQGTGLDVRRFISRTWMEAPIQAVFTSDAEHSLGYQDPVQYLTDVLGPAPTP